MRIILDRNSQTTLSRQLYEAIRERILSGRLKPGEKFPSSRLLSEQLNLARATVLLAIEQLVAEGYLRTIAASGTVVSRDIPRTAPSRTSPTPLTEFGQLMQSTDLQESPKEKIEISFFPGQPDLKLAPVEELTRSIWRKHRQTETKLLEFPSERAGSDSLRKMLTERVLPRRGIKCSFEQVIVTNGFQHILDLVVRLHAGTNDLVAIEEPGFLEVRRTLESYKIKIKPIAVDEDGLDVEQLSGSGARLVVVTPSHHFPTGAVLSLNRRMKLLEWAKTEGAMILEDDYDSEFQYSGTPIPAMQGLDMESRVIYAGSFSKLLYPSFGIGYCVVPESLKQTYLNARRISCDPTPVQLQESLADFIEEGHLHRHERRMKEIYAERRALMLRLLRRHLGKRVTISGDNAGLHVLVRFNSQLSDHEIETRARKRGVGIVSTTSFYAGQSRRGEFALGYGNLDDEQIEEGLRRLSLVLTK